MKEQFLNLSGLIDLVTYMKLCIAQHKVIIPRASFSLFPETGDENNIYIDTSTNAIYRWNDTDKKFVLLAKPPRTIAISEGTNNGEITLKVDNIASNAKVHGLTSTAFTESNKFATAAQGAKADSAVQTITLSSGTKNGTIKIKVNNITTDNIEVAGLGSAAFSDIGIFAAKSHTHKKDEVGLGNVDNTADLNKSVKYATSAGSIDWSGIKNKPSAYPPPQDFYDDRFYTKGQVDSKLSGKSDTGHTHVQFIQETKFSNGTYADPLKDVSVAIKASGGIAADLIYEGGSTLSSKYQAKGSYASSTHTHDDRYYTETEMNSKLAGKAEKSHTHDDRYYTESEIDTKLSGKSDIGHDHQNIISLGAKAPTASGTTANSPDSEFLKDGISLTEIYNYGTTPITYGNIINVIGSNHPGAGQLLLGWSGADNTTEHLYYRSHRDTKTGGWGPWKTVAFITDNVASASSVPWSGVQDKPSTFPPSSHSHTKSQIIDFPAAIKNPSSIKIQLNGGTTEGTNQFIYDGSAAKTINITPSIIGASAFSHTHPISSITSLQTTLDNKAALNHSHSYLPLSGGTLTGQLKINGTAASQPLIVRGIVGSDSNGSLGDLHLQFGANYPIKLGNEAAYSISADGGTYTGKAATAGVADSANAVAWANVSGKPSSYPPSTHTHSYAGSSTVGGSANSAVKLDSSAGSSVQPVYFSNGKPVATTYSLNKTVPADAKFTDTNTWRGVQNNLTSDSTDQSLSAAQGKILKNLVDEKIPHSTIDTAIDLNTLTETGIYHIKTTSYTNAPATNHSTIFVDFTVGTPYQIFIPDASNTMYKRNYNKSAKTWSGWAQMKFTDTVYKHPSYTAKTAGLYKVTVDTTGHVSATTAVTKADITGLGIPGSDTNTWRGIQNNLTSDSTSDSLSAAQGKVLKGLVDGKAASNHNHDSIYSKLDHTHSYLPLSGGTLTGALKLANNTWNTIGDDVKIGDMNIGGTLGIMGNNGNTGIKLVVYNASTTSGASSPGVTWTCTADGQSTMSGTLSGTFKGNLTGNASSATTASSCSGNAATATKLATARNIALSGYGSGSANFDGSGNITIDDWGYGVAKYINENSTSTPYTRIAYASTDHSWYDGSMVFVIDSGYANGGYGIIKVCMRSNDIRTKDNSTCEVRWLVRQVFSADQIFIKGYAPENGIQYADLYFKANGTYNAITIRVLSSGGRGNRLRTWTFDGSASRANPDIRTYSYTVTGCDSGTANYANSAGAVTWGNVSGKPSTFTPSSHTHNYAGSGSAGGSANSAVKLDTSAGSATQPVYFSGGKPVACSYTLGKSVPSNAVFTDTNTTYPISYRTIDNNFASKYRTQTKGNTSAGDYISTLRCDTNSVPYAPQYGTGLGWGRGDTHGYLYMNYSSPQVYVGAGNADKLNWAKQLAFADHIHSYTEIANRPTLIKAVSKNNYWGMADHDGNDSSWIRTTSNGIIPYQSGGAGAGHCGIGTSSWYFSNAYIDTVNCVNTNASELISTSLEYRSCRGGEVNRDWRFGSATGSGDQNWFGFYDYTYGYHGGIYGPGHSLRMGGEIQSTAANGFRAVQGKYGFIIRNDGANVYFMMTGNGDPWGGWNDNYTVFTPNGEWQVKKSPYDNGMSTARGYVVVSDSNDNRVYSISNYNENYLKVRCGLNTYHCTYSNSDIRLKKNINNTSITNALSVINSIKVRQFDWKETNIHQSIGFVADELEKLDPNFSQGGGVTKDGGIDVKSVNSFYLQGYIVKALQELSSQVSDLKQENKRLKQKLNMCN